MLAFGFWGKTRTKDSADFLVAGRRLGPVLYTGTMAAVVLGGASTVGGVGLGYKFGISGMWLVVAIAVGLLLLSLVFAGRIQRLKVYTVAQMLKLRYGIDATSASGIVMVAYTLMLSVTSTIAYATIFNVLFNTDRTLSVIIGGAIVMLYSSIGGMWSITLTDMVQFLLKTIGVFFLLLPVHLEQGGRPRRHQGAGRGHCFDLGAIGMHTIITLLRRLQPRNADRPGHLAARVHRAVPAGREVGWHDRGDLLPAVRRRRRTDRHRGIDIPPRRSRRRTTSTR